MMIKIGHLVNSSLWITVFIVRVGCIIEAHATTIDTAAVDLASLKDSKETLSLFSPSSSLRHVGVKKKISSSHRLFTSRSLGSSPQILKSSMSITTTTTNNNNPPLPAHHQDDENSDSCSGKGDGYFPNYGSDCTSYYFCAAGYQITYVCPPDSRFNEKSKKCEEDGVCLGGSKGGFPHRNLCDSLPNGYYTKEVSSPKYYYCYNNAKVIDLICDFGKIFNGNKCIMAAPPPLSSLVSADDDGHDDKLNLDSISCDEKPNGFYPIPNSECSKYYFCISGVKTELRCEARLVFNGQVCVHPLRYKCPDHYSAVAAAADSNNSNTINDDQNWNSHNRTADDEKNDQKGEFDTFDSTSFMSTSMTTTTTTAI